MINIEELAYSFHLGRNNKKNNTNNSIQNKQQLSKIDNHNFRKYDNVPSIIHVVKGSKSVYEDVEKSYKEIFESARLEYNNKQDRPSRMINDYFDNVSNNEKKDLACEIIIELGDKLFWEDKDFDYKKKMISVYRKQVQDLEKLLPNFKVANAVIHFDETSPHMHIVGIPIKEGLKNGMKIQVGKSDVFTKESLTKLQDNMRKLCIEEFNNIYQTNKTLKKKQKGRNRDINVKDMNDYISIAREIQINQSSIYNTKDTVERLENDINDLGYIVKQLNNNRSYKLTYENIKILNDLFKDLKSLNNDYSMTFKDLSNVNIIHMKLRDLEEVNKDLNEKLDKLNKSLVKEKYASLVYKNHTDECEKIIEDYKRNNKVLVNILKNKVKKPKSKDTFINFSKQLYENNVLSKFELSNILPNFKFNNRSIEYNVKKINNEMNETIEEFYTKPEKKKNNDYEL